MADERNSVMPMGELETGGGVTLFRRSMGAEQFRQASSMILDGPLKKGDALDVLDIDRRAAPK